MELLTTVSAADRRSCFDLKFEVNWPSQAIFVVIESSIWNTLFYVQPTELAAPSAIFQYILQYFNCCRRLFKAPPVRSHCRYFSAFRGICIFYRRILKFAWSNIDYSVVFTEYLLVLLSIALKAIEIIEDQVSLR